MRIFTVLFVGLFLMACVAPSLASNTPPQAPVCAACGVTNDPDAKFCKGCGAKL